MRQMATTLIVLVCAVPALRAEDKTPADQLKEIRAEANKASQDWTKEYQAAKTQEERQKLLQNRPKYEKQISSLLELAEKNTKDTEVAFEALFLVVNLARGGKQTDKALKLLTKDFSNYEKMTVAQVLGIANADSEEAAGFLKAVATNHKDKTLQGASTFGQGLAVRERAETLSFSERKPETAKQIEELTKEAEKCFETVIDKYKDVEIPWGRNRTVKLGTKAEANLFEMRKLKVDQPIPDEALELLDGKKVKLSDYRGKVVVLDIWATWCPPCRAMIPHEREMVKKLADKPFVLMSLSADAEKATLESFLKTNEMPWTHVHVGNDGGLTEKWNVRFFPTIYVIDAKGVIRHKNIRDKQMEEAVEKLIKEAEEASKKSS